MEATITSWLRLRCYDNSKGKTNKKVIEGVLLHAGGQEVAHLSKGLVDSFSHIVRPEHSDNPEANDQYTSSEGGGVSTLPIPHDMTHDEGMHHLVTATMEKSLILVGKSH